jgi:hypothetical protein
MHRLSYIGRTWRTGHYLVVGAVMFLIIVLGVTYRNIDAITGFYESTESLGKTIGFVGALVGGIGVVLSLLGAVALSLFGLLIGINTVLLFQYIKRKRQQTLCIEFDRSSKTAAVSGTVASIFGIGCAACGSAIIFAFLNIFGAGSLLLLLPLQGEEFSILGIALLGYATWMLLGRMST